MKVVLDTNIVVSAYLVPVDPPARILALWRAAAFDLLVSENILLEYERLLSHPRITARHGMLDEEVVDEIAAYREYAILVEPQETLHIVKEDPDDDKFFECGVAGDASYIVSRDTEVLAVKSYRGIRVITPEAFLAVLEERW